MSVAKTLLIGILGALLSGGLVALASGLHPVWWVAWIASTPVLVTAFKTDGRTAWFLGLVAGLAGGLSIIGYYIMVTTLPIALIITFLKAIVFAGGVSFAFGVRKRFPEWAAVFAFPFWFAAFDTVIAAFSANGTAGSLAYSQMDLPIALQVAALGGAPAVTFLVCLCSSVLALVIASLDDAKRAFAAAAPGLVVLSAAIGFGYWRIESAADIQKVRVAMAAIDPERALPDDWRAAVESYRPKIAGAAADHAKFLVLPEEIAIVPAEEIPLVRADLGGFAVSSGVNVAVGFRISNGGQFRNRLYIFASDGRALEYDKQHLVPGFESPMITPGSEPVLVDDLVGYRIGGAICKDLDFVDVGRALGNGNAALALVPAWDFGVDAWLHARMAMLRAVEGGFTLVRSARSGSMSVSDRFGRVLAEAPSGPDADLLKADAPVPDFSTTIYARFGDVFGWASVVTTLLLLAGRFRQERWEK